MFPFLCLVKSNGCMSIVSGNTVLHCGPYYSNKLRDACWQRNVTNHTLITEIVCVRLNYLFRFAAARISVTTSI